MNQRLVVHKFGGTSLADAQRIGTAVDRLLECQAAGDRPLAVASAMGGVTNHLLASPEQGDDPIAALKARHLSTLEAIGGGGFRLADELRALLADAASLLAAASVLGELTPAAQDRLSATGEKLSVRLVAHALRQRGVEAVAVDADTFLETDARFGNATPLAGVADRLTRSALQPLLDKGIIPVVTGFCGRAPNGATTTIGRSGSDYTATLVAAALGAREVVIWTDVDGVFTADPRVVPSARRLDQLNYREAAELSYYGAKVLHPRTLAPVQGARIPVWIKNSFAPNRQATVVDGRFTPGSHPVKAISAVRGQAIVSLEGTGMAGLPGVASRMFAALAERSISVTMISQSDSEASICVVLPEVDAARAEGAIRAAFRADLAAGLIEDVRVRPHVGIIAAVGLGMAHTTGIAGRLLTSLGDARVNVIAIAQGSSELNISVAIDGSHVDRAIEAVHRTFGLAQKDTGRDAHTGLDLLLLGGGRIARELLTQLRSRQAHIEARFGLVVRLVGVADSSGFLLEPSGLSPERIDGLVQAKASGDPIHTLPGGVRGTAAELVAAAREWRLSRPIVVDVTDANDHDRLFLSAFEAGYDVVTANKKPLAGSEASYRALQAATADGSRLLKAETTVGAGLPVVDTLEMLHATGDRLLGAFGSLSGTLAYLMAELEGGAKLSVAVERAKELGYTEPDPVADLSGVDVARKAIILGRISGLAPHAEVHLEGLVDASLAGCSHEELMATLRTLDPVFERRIAEAAERGAVLRYAARVQKDRIEVGPIEVGRSEPLGQLQGSDNLIVFTSERYSERPLVVSGPGAGVAVTAMGVLGDILRIAAERR